MTWSITPLIDTTGNGLVLSSDGKYVTVKNDIGAPDQLWVLTNPISDSSQSKVILSENSNLSKVVGIVRLLLNIIALINTTLLPSF